MSTARAGTPGATRVCPHCKAVVLETAAVCPGCRHHLRFNATDAQLAGAEAYCAFNIEGTIAHKQSGEHCEYCIVLDIRNERGEQVMRQVVGVGALHPGELRRLNLAVEMLPVRAAVASKSEQPAARDPRRAAAPSAPARPAAASSTIASPAAPAPSRASATPALVAQSPAAKPATAPAAPAASAAGKPSTPAAATIRPASERAADESGSTSQRLRLFRKP
jgi:hypothetical protein